MLLVVDVGNTNMVIGVYKEEKLIYQWRMKTDKESTADEIGIFIYQLFTLNSLDMKEVKGVIISSVVPPIMYSLERAFSKYFNIKPLIVGPGLKTGMNIKIDNPRELGADRIVNGVAAYHKYGGPVIVIDFGTATTYDVITVDGEYIGGVISPGIKISVDALAQRASKLPRIEISKLDSIIGKNTISCIQAGIYYGYIGQVEYIVNRIKQELKSDNIKVVSTGGLANLIAEEANCIDIVDSILTLDGLRYIYNKNIQKPKIH